MPDNQENVLDEYTELIFKVVAECYANGKNKNAKPNVREFLHVVWNKSRDEANGKYLEAIKKLAEGRNANNN